MVESVDVVVVVMRDPAALQLGVQPLLLPGCQRLQDAVETAVDQQQRPALGEQGETGTGAFAGGDWLDELREWKSVCRRHAPGVVRLLGEDLRKVEVERGDGGIIAVKPLQALDGQARRGSRLTNQPSVRRHQELRRDISELLQAGGQFLRRAEEAVVVRPGAHDLLLQGMHVPELPGGVDRVAAENGTARGRACMRQLDDIRHGAIRHPGRVQHADGEPAPLEPVALCHRAAEGDVVQRRQGTRAEVVQVPAVVPALPVC